MRPTQCLWAFLSRRKDEKDASDDAFVLKMFSRGREDKRCFEGSTQRLRRDMPEVVASAVPFLPHTLR